jgi:uncharacterized membrane protein YkoI
MSRTTKKILIGGALTVVFAGMGAGFAKATDSGDDSSDVPISGTALDEAGKAALAETGGGTVVDSEVEDNGYEVEVNLDNGTQVEVELDQNYAVVSSSVNDEGDDSDVEDD